MTTGSNFDSKGSVERTPSGLPPQVPPVTEKPERLIDKRVGEATAGLPAAPPSVGIPSERKTSVETPKAGTAGKSHAVATSHGVAPEAPKKSETELRNEIGEIYQKLFEETKGSMKAAFGTWGGVIGYEFESKEYLDFLRTMYNFTKIEEDLGDTISAPTTMKNFTSNKISIEEIIDSVSKGIAALEAAYNNGKNGKIHLTRQNRDDILKLKQFLEDLKPLLASSQTSAASTEPPQKPKPLSQHAVEVVHEKAAAKPTTAKKGMSALKKTAVALLGLTTTAGIVGFASQPHAPITGRTVVRGGEIMMRGTTGALQTAWQTALPLIESYASAYQPRLIDFIEIPDFTPVGVGSSQFAPLKLSQSKTSVVVDDMDETSDVAESEIKPPLMADVSFDTAKDTIHLRPGEERGWQTHVGRFKDQNGKSLKLKSGDTLVPVKVAKMRGTRTTRATAETLSEKVYLPGSFFQNKATGKKVSLTFEGQPVELTIQRGPAIKCDIQVNDRSLPRIITTAIHHMADGTTETRLDVPKPIADFIDNLTDQHGNPIILKEGDFLIPLTILDLHNIPGAEALYLTVEGRSLSSMSYLPGSMLRELKAGDKLTFFFKGQKVEMTIKDRTGRGLLNFNMLVDEIEGDLFGTSPVGTRQVPVYEFDADGRVMRRQMKTYTSPPPSTRHKKIAERTARHLKLYKELAAADIKEWGEVVGRLQISESVYQRSATRSDYQFNLNEKTVSGRLDKPNEYLATSGGYKVESRVDTHPETGKRTLVLQISGGVNNGVLALTVTDSELIVQRQGDIGGFAIMDLAKENITPQQIREGIPHIKNKDGQVTIPLG